MAKIGIFGGSFNPIHAGHLAIARRALDEFHLDRLYVVPAALSPFKTRAACPEYARSAAAAGFSAPERMELVRAACAGDARLAPSDIEIARGGISFTIDTVREIAARHPGAELFLVIGEDSAPGLPRWKDADTLRKLCKIVVYPRTAESSTEIRRRLAAGEKIGDLVPPAVEKAIAAMRGGKTRAGRVAIPHVGWSSCCYPLEAADLARAAAEIPPDLPDAALPDDETILFIAPDRQDVLVRGKERVTRLAAAQRHATVDTRIVFVPSAAKWNLVATLVRVVRNRYRYHGTGIYHLSAKAIRALGLERTIRSIDNPQPRAGQDRAAAMKRLVESLRSHGYDDSRPLNIMLCRTGGCIDSLRQGHHRISACLDCGIDRVAVQFSAAGALPALLGRRRRLGISVSGGEA